MIQRAVQQIEKALPILTICLIPIHLIGSCINAINSIDKGYGHSYPIETYLLMGLYLLIVIAVDLHILFKQQFVYIRGYLFYWGCSSVIIIFSLLGLIFFDTYTIGPIIVLPLMSSPYGILFPLLESFFIENSPSNMCFISLLFCLLNYSLCKFIRSHGVQ